MTTSRRISLLLLCSAALLSGCSQDDQADTPEPEASESVTQIPGGPRLLTLDDPPGPNDILRDRNISGTLAVNESNCYTLGHRILVAPYGSTILDDGSAITMPGIGTFAVGDHIETGGSGAPKVKKDWLTCRVGNRLEDAFVIPN